MQHINQPIKLFSLTALLLLSALTSAAQGNESEDQQQAYKLHYPDMSYDVLRKAIDKGEVFIIDANRTENYVKGHIPGAYSIKSREELKQSLPELKKFPIVVYCWSEQCTAWQKAADFAFANGYTNVSHFSGGIEEWKRQGDVLATIND